MPRRIIKEKSNKRIIALTVITTMIVLCVSLSKYMSTIASNTKTKVAKVVLDLNVSNVLELQMIPIENSRNFQELDFTIINGTEEKKTDVTMSYIIELSSLSNLPLDFELYKLNEETKEYDRLELASGITVDRFEIKTSDDKQSYKIKIFWKDGVNYTNYKYADLLDYVLITVDSKQVD